jgi:serine/threonine-protein kinase
MEGVELTPGTIVGGRYRVERLLGRGGMGVVVEATDVARGGTCAVKVLRSRFVDSTTVVERFRREARILDAIEHPAIVRIRDCGETEQGVFIAMELLRGETLLERLRREGVMSPAALAPIVEGLCDALAAVHAEGVIHRDLKPANVFLPEGGETAVSLIDFGVAKVLDLARLTLTGQVVGTLSYMAPEQLSGRPVDERVDIYAVGVMLHGALRGKPPFPREAHLAVQAILAGDVPALESVPAPIAAVVAKAMAIDPGHRFGTARELASAFRSAVAAPSPDTATTRAIGAAPARLDAPGPVTAPTVVARPQRSETVTLPASSTGRWLAIAGGLVLLLAATGIAVLATAGSDDGAEDRTPAAVLEPQPPAPPTPAPGAISIPRSIEIASTPTGAGVYEGDVMLGNTPFTVVMAAGDPPRRLELQQAGYERTVLVVRTEDERHDVTLPGKAVERPRPRPDRGRPQVQMRSAPESGEVMDPW